MHYALETTRATAVCPFHPDVILRISDDTAGSHAFERAKKVIKSNGPIWEPKVLMEEIRRQLSEAADGEGGGNTGSMARLPARRIVPRAFASVSVARARRSRLHCPEAESTLPAMAAVAGQDASTSASVHDLSSAISLARQRC